MEDLQCVDMTKPVLQNTYSLNVTVGVEILAIGNDFCMQFGAGNFKTTSIKRRS